MERKNLETSREELPRRGFGSHQDVLDYARLCVEDSNRWLAANSLDLVKGYTELK